MPEQPFFCRAKSHLNGVFRASKVGLPANGLCAFQHLYSHKKPPETPVIPASARTALAALALLISAGAAHAQSGAADGQKLAFDRGKGNCLTCHAIKGGDLPGTIGPELKDIKSKFPDRNERVTIAPELKHIKGNLPIASDLVAILNNETKRNPQTVMPPFGRSRILTEQE